LENTSPYGARKEEAFSQSMKLMPWKKRTLDYYGKDFLDYPYVFVPIKSKLIWGEP